MRFYYSIKISLKQYCLVCLEATKLNLFPVMFSLFKHIPKELCEFYYTSYSGISASGKMVLRELYLHN